MIVVVVVVARVWAGPGDVGGFGGVCCGGCWGLWFGWLWVVLWVWLWVWGWVFWWGCCCVGIKRLAVWRGCRVTILRVVAWLLPSSVFRLLS
ncbi:hypothetical protein RA267_27940, partial [Pseudomonas syringae pv. tagetis]|uniref:hypothetical protein n=1 Tax=Pseudomonas syringae group genomosp. 7 TaxID=251699 RepID=UPI00376FE5A3